MIIARVIMFVVACFALIIIVNMICNCIIESKKDTDEGNVYTVNFEKEEEKDKR